MRQPEFPVPRADGVQGEHFYKPLYGVRNLDQTLGVSVASLGWGRFSTVEYVSATGYIVGEGGNLQGNGRVYLLRRK